MIRITALEIVGHPHDLRLLIGEAKEQGPNGSWFMTIGRGPGHSFKPLISLDQPDQLLPSREAALNTVQLFLYLALAGVLIPAGSCPQKLCEVRGEEALRAALREVIEELPPAPADCLTLALVDQVMATLGKQDECRTWEME